MHDAAAMDMFVVVTMSFRLLFAMVIINLDRRKILHVSATEHPTQNWLANEVTDAFVKAPEAKLSDQGPGPVLRSQVLRARQRVGHPGTRDAQAVAVGEHVCRAGDLDDPARVPRPRDHPERRPSPANFEQVRRLL